MSAASKSPVAGVPVFDVTRPAAESGVYGQVERHQGLRVLRLWGTAEERGYAHGYLLAKDIHAIMSDEFAARFADDLSTAAVVPLSSLTVATSGSSATRLNCVSSSFTRDSTCSLCSDRF